MRCFPKATLVDSNGELKLPALIRGNGQQRICDVTTAKNYITRGSGWDQIFRMQGKIQDRDDFEDGIYELVLGTQVFALTTGQGEYQEIRAPVPKAGIPPVRRQVTPPSLKPNAFRRGAKL